MLIAYNVIYIYVMSDKIAYDLNDLSTPYVKGLDSKKEKKIIGRITDLTMWKER